MTISRASIFDGDHERKAGASDGYTAPYGLGGYGHCKVVAEGDAEVARRVSLTGQMTYRRQTYCLGRANRGRVAWVRERGGRLAVRVGRGRSRQTGIFYKVEPGIGPVRIRADHVRIMSILDDMDAWVDEFAAFPNWAMRYSRIIELGRGLRPMDEALKIEANRVRGCASAVWIHAAVISAATGGQTRIAIQADSDAVLVRGLVALLIQVYSQRTPQEILDAPPDFLESLGLNINLSMNRANGLSAVVAQIREYAQSFQTQ